jgi:DNA repair photolyase
MERIAPPPGLSEDVLPDMALKGRGAVGNQHSSRFDRKAHFRVDDGWQHLYDEEDAPKKLETILGIDTSKTILTKPMPEAPIDRGLNPYKGCEHGCIYCYARPSHAYLGLSPGLDFETKIFHKPNAPELLRQEMAKPSYKVETIVVGSNTDPYQPIERELQLTRRILEVLAEVRHPFVIITKSALVLRDVDILAPLARKNLVHVCVSLTTLDADLARIMEPRAATPAKRVATIKGLSESGVPVALMAAPMIPFVNDHELEAIMQAAYDAGARHAAYTFVRLSYELEGLFGEWLSQHFPDRAARVMNHIREAHGGKTTTSMKSGKRRSGTGAYAAALRARYKMAHHRLGFSSREDWFLDNTQFIKPSTDGRQLRLL